MDQTTSIAQQALDNPPKELMDLLNDPRTSDEAKEAVLPLMANALAGSKLDSNGLEDGRLQVVDEDQVFTLSVELHLSVAARSRKQLSPYLAKWGLLDKGFSYDVVAVFGSQSTGKSTLLNRLFGTSFQVMDESKRQQTTKGIWMCPSAFSSTLVMDVEGTDGRERGEDQDFERKSALFSLASTEVLLVNLWEHQIGLYQGANMGLLKTVFEVNLGLFGGGGDGAKAKTQEKTLILFVIRDHVGSTPLANLTATLTQDMEKIWHSLSKPAHLADTSLYDYFDLSFAALPHKVLMPEQFEKAVLDLRKRFTERSQADYVFKPAYHKRIPADGVGFYMEGIWQQVLSNKDLDLPTQQELLAQFRCDEIAQVVIEAFLTASKATRRPVETGSIIQGLGALMVEWRTTALGKFDRDASRYHPAVYARKRVDLLKQLDSSLSPLFLGQLKNLHKNGVLRFRTEIADELKGDGYDFAEVTARIRDNVRNEFVESAQEMHLPETDWEYIQELDLLDDDLKLIADECRAAETKKMVSAVDRTIKRQIAEPVEVALAKPSKSMWDEVLLAFKTISQKGEAAYLAKAKSFNCTADENAAALESLRTRAWLALRRRLEDQTSDASVLAILRATFEERFRYDEGGIPRVWKPEDDIEGAFRIAKDETLAMLPLYATVDPSDETLLPKLPTSDSLDLTDDNAAFDPETAFTLLSPTKVLALESRFRREADATFVEAKRSMVSSVAKIPVWIYGAMVVLGWNEAMAVLFNPIYFAMLAVLGASAYIVLQLGLLGPLIQVSRTVVGEVQRIGTEKLREAFAEDPALRAQLNAPYTASSKSNSTEMDEKRSVRESSEKVEFNEKS